MLLVVEIGESSLLLWRRRLIKISEAPLLLRLLRLRLLLRWLLRVRILLAKVGEILLNLLFLWRRSKGIVLRILRTAKICKTTLLRWLLG